MLNNVEILTSATQALMLVLTGSIPSIMAAAIAGVAVALFQALTQIQDQGLPTAVKFFGVLFTLFITYQSTGSAIATYAKAIFDKIAGL
jgi:type III secretion protein S